jgi:hypothetical protein
LLGLSDIDKKALVAEMTAQGLTGAKIKQVIGATKDAQVRVYMVGKGEITSVRTPNYTMMRTLKRASDGTKYIKNDSFYMTSKGTGLGTKIFARQVKQASKAGYSKIVTDAAGRKGMSDNGYYTWARLGYNAPLSAADRSALPKKFRKAKDIQQLMAMKGGKEMEGTWLHVSRHFRLKERLPLPPRTRRVLEGKEEECLTKSTWTRTTNEHSTPRGRK